MARDTNTFIQSSSAINREELADVVSRITPEDTPLYSMMKKGRCNSVHPEWVNDELAAPAANAVAEGDTYTFTAITPAERPGNYCQIFRKSFQISGTQEAVANAADVEKIRYQSLKKGVEIRKDIEYAILAPTASTSTDPRKLGSLPTWPTSNTLRGSSGTDGGYKSADGFTDAPMDGTQRAFTKTIMDNVMQQCYESGADVKNIVMSPYVKSVFVSFINGDGTAAFRNQVNGGDGNAIVATADVYHGPFGSVRVVPDRVAVAAAAAADKKATARNVWFIDPMMLEFKWLRKIQRDAKVAKIGDAMRYVILGEGTLCVKNERGIGLAADIFGVNSAA